MDLSIRRVLQKDKAEWLRMRKGIWPEASDEDLDFDMDDILSSETNVVFFACDAGKPIGLTEAQIRETAEGCETSPVGYLEGCFVQQEYRGKGVVIIMGQAAENWSREKGCTEMASDTWLENESSIRAHARMGYIEVERLVHFVKQL